MNKYSTSSGERVSEATISKRRSEAYRKLYDYVPMCGGCGKVRAQGSAHAVPQAYAKSHGMAELCWLPENIFPACNRCNQMAENPSSEDIKTLLNYSTILEVTKKYAPTRYQKMI